MSTAKTYVRPVTTSSKRLSKIADAADSFPEESGAVALKIMSGG